MKAKFTKGPWKKCRRGETLIGENNKGVGIYDCGLVGVNKSEEAVANSYLIAATPDMYKEIEQDIEWLQRLSKDYVAGSHVLRSILLRIKTKKSLLSKARGE